MKTIRRLPPPVFIAAGAVLLLVVAVGAFTFARGGDGPGSGPTVTGTEAAATASTLPEEPAPDEQTFENASPLPEPTEAEPQAQGSENRAPAAPKAPEAPAKQGSSDGCNHAYGPVSACVPVALPGYLSSREDKCAWLAANGLKAITVTGADKLGLDPDKNGVACD